MTSGLVTQHSVMVDDYSVIVDRDSVKLIQNSRIEDHHCYCPVILVQGDSVISVLVLVTGKDSVICGPDDRPRRSPARQCRRCSSR